MSKAFTREDQSASSEPAPQRFVPLSPGVPNLITAAGADRLRQELTALQDSRQSTVDEEKRRILAHRIEELEARLRTHEVVKPLTSTPRRVSFGTKVTILDGEGEQRCYCLVGLDEADPVAGLVSWTSPVARALLNQEVGALVSVVGSRGAIELEIIAIEPL